MAFHFLRANFAKQSLQKTSVQASYGLLLGLFVRPYYVRHSTPGYLNLNVIWFYAQYKSIIVYANDCPDNPSARDHRLPIHQRLQHLFLILLLPPHRHEHQEVEDSDHQRDGQKAAEERISRRG